jgi:hypothetical protein
MNPEIIAIVAGVAAIAASPEIIAFSRKRLAKTPAAIDRSRWVNDLFALAAQANSAGEPAIAEAAKSLIAALVNVEVKK